MTTQHPDLPRLSQMTAMVVIVFLLPAAFNSRMSYSYYLNLHWVVFLGFLIEGWLRRHSNSLLLASIGVSIIFCPFIHFHLSRSTWIILDWFVIILAALFILSFSTKKIKSDNIE